MKKASFVYSENQLSYQFHSTHPFNHQRLRLTYDLLKSMDALDDSEIVAPRVATEAELRLIHDQAFIDAVKAAGNGTLSDGVALNYGLGTEDTPIFKNMHEAAALLVGGTLTAVDQVMEGHAEHACHLGGGLHHGFRGKASGFCVYNDSSIAIEYMRRKFGARVLYIDTDAHHGDGVQWAFYEEDDVCTLSIHETGRYLFPGTGNFNEKGQGEGYGYSINIPLDAFTEDDSFLFAYEQAVTNVVKFFKPDVILTQNGADAHFHDPLTHLCASMRTFRYIPQLAHALAHEYCEGRWIAVGGGGYDIWRVVPRAWAMIWLEMTDQLQKANGPLPERWLSKWTTYAQHPLPSHWEDENEELPTIPRRDEITEKNKKIVEKALYHIYTELKTQT
ncbi:acetoin utilization protein AcuC [Halalkalibacterium halodurans]|jgi:acetoin utilization protein AcuC|uniref:Acetoin utilization protein AcuC n=2 Tax=Halalkalibacterium halodurans TaxID=86665 RepID=Q9K7X1_HALH5|nr:acetoin utilization protein AcuC [Halalkalibacterium halodurans]MED3645946.1 acetoin utilization protein AcuC [Halalkalibacterium halodurans]MED4080010.1 acetoin utilization protein AcuC [Halalkalibacterium halodurans]MED4084418.1 acetoin utilization protein AcuC [Halalkalibacterium halodurans]MED4104986.1 acetoin utilization protein AcuC [Halalkalibacterium halodurans]MED4107373.1 acetoin utilization protein AcuC [Halalkalibacterium halodurans]